MAPGHRLTKCPAWGALLLVSAVAHGGTVFYVDDDAPSGGDGLTWSTAYRFLPDAIAVAADPGGVSEIRVAQGTYAPDRDEAFPAGTGDRAATFSMLNGVSLKGGYAGIGAADPDLRDVELFETVLTGDLANDDDLTPVESCCAPHETPSCDDPVCAADVCAWMADCCSVAWDPVCVGLALSICDPSCPEQENNSLHVVTSTGNDGSAVLSGFTVTGGYSFAPNGVGGGLHCATDSSPTVVDCLLHANFASAGGAISIHEGTPTIDSCDFTRNVGTTGGAIRNNNGSALILDSTFTSNGGGFLGGAINNSGELITVVESTFLDNAADGAGVIFDLSGSVDLVGCVFEGNRAGSGGGVFYGFSSVIQMQECSFVENTAANGSGGAILLNSGIADISSCLFTGNHCMGTNGNGGAIYLGNLSTQGARIVNCTIANNSALNTAGGIYLDEESLLLANSIVWGNTDGGLSVESAQVTVNKGAVLEMLYSCVEGLSGALGGWANIGDKPAFADIDGPDDIPGTADDDLHLTEGSPCINRGTADISLPLGALDIDGDTRIRQCRVDVGADESPFFASDCNANKQADDCDLLSDAGTDCNGNGVLDECDIASEYSADCNDNGFPDDCDVQPDLYRLDDGTEDNNVQANDGDLIWFNEFTAMRDNEVIVAVDICWGIVAEGTPTDIAVWIDPNDDGDPIDALLVALVLDVPAVNPQTGMFNTIAIPPTFVGHTGEVFYVGAHASNGPSDYPSCVDQTLPHRRKSWAVIGDNLHFLWANTTLPPVLLDDACPECSGNWLIRARRIGSDDADQNGIPDECTLGDINGDGVVGVGDLLALLGAWGPCINCVNCPADLDGNCFVDVSDLLILLANWDVG